MAYQTKRPLYRKPRPKHRWRIHRKFFIMGSAVLFCLLFFCFLFFFTDLFAPRGVPQKINGLSPNTNVFACNGNLVYLKGSTLSCIDQGGKEKWSYKFSSASLSLAASDSLICAYNSDSATVLDANKNPLFTIPQSKFKIISVRCGKESIVMLTQLGLDEDMLYLRIFSKDGAELDRVELGNTFVIDYGLFGANDSQWTLTLDASGVAPISRITTRAPAQQALTGNFELSNQLVEQVFFYNNEISLSGTTNLTTYNTFGEKISEKLIYGLKYADCNSSEKDFLYAYVPRDAGNEIYAVRLLSREGVDSLIQLPKGIKWLAIGQNKVYAFTEASILVYRNTGAFDQEIPLDFKLTGISKLSANSVLLKSETDLYSLSLS